ncbi:MAG TPA: N-6 DNA methylase, partial [Candidatus Deferrimicrobium sp.]|nr:N-6 DNA methylase [Candidatus Deferrimicrobium sp.]
MYNKLDFKNGGLYPAVAGPSASLNEKDWIEKGEWFAAANRAGAETIFFVDNNPVAVFAQCDGGPQEKIKAFNRMWCLARPRLLFLASPGEIAVYDLAQKPVNENKEEDWKKLEPLDILKNIHLVSEEVQKYHRDNIESGRVFEDKRFGDLKNRADQALIRDLKTVRGELIHAGLSGHRVRFAHALIGRSIFIRYLEDRGILTKDYFLNVAGQKLGWTNLLKNPVSRPGLESSNLETYYPRVLENKEFTYALFKALALDFNGDMFPGVEEEEKVVTREHLKLIQDLLYGDVGVQKKLFFYSYRFDIVPLDLISSIYEEFYHISTAEDEKSSKKRQDGAYYTPSVLVEFIISRILTAEVLEKKPRVLDPACGSGIFLVEAFRRIVRYEWFKNKQDLAFGQLRRILKEQIAGIEVNEEAARITAFSLYLSMLHYLEPKAIDQQVKMGNKLPNLLAKNIQSQNHFHCILPGNAFDTKFIQSNSTWKERFGAGCADVIVGNPPWGAPGVKADIEAKERHQKLLDWCKSNGKTIGDKESSQAFLWRALDFLKENGKAAMLVSAGVLFKHNTTTQDFRSQWFNQVKLNDIFNFIHIRKFFFKSAISPFLSVCFSKGKQLDSPVYYWSAKQTINIDKTQSIVFSRYDRHILRPGDVSSVTIWKELWFGRKADTELLRFLQRKKRLQEFSYLEKCGRGYEIASKNRNAEALQPFKSTKIESFSRYDSLEFSNPPKKIYRLGNLNLYEGKRLLVRRGVLEKTTAKGLIVARFENEPFCFTNALHGVKLKSAEDWEYKTILGILWSSLTRYFFFISSSNWGLWHHEIHLHDELLQLPMVIEKSNPATHKIISIVDKLRSYQPKMRDLFHLDGVPGEEIEAQRKKWEADLDDAVFELYCLNEEQMDLIRDL